MEWLIIAGSEVGGTFFLVRLTASKHTRQHGAHGCMCDNLELTIGTFETGDGFPLCLECYLQSSSYHTMTVGCQ